MILKFFSRIETVYFCVFQTNRIPCIHSCVNTGHSVGFFYLTAQKRLIKGKQDLIDFVKVIVPFPNEILQDNICLIAPG